MCTVTAMVIASAGQSVASHIGQVQAASADNRNRARLYRHQQGKLYGDHFKNINEYYLRGVDAERQWASNVRDYSTFLGEQQNKMNKTIAESLRYQEKSFVEATSNQRIAQSLERSGKSAGRIASSLKASRGRGVAESYAKIDQQRDAFFLASKKMFAMKQKSDQKALSMIGIEPQRGIQPVKPTWNKGPSLFSLAANVAGSAVTGYAAGTGMKLDGGFLFPNLTYPPGVPS